MNERRRIRGGDAGKGGGKRRLTGGKIATGSITATLIGAVVRDLTRPNSIIRGLIAYGRERLAARSGKPVITDDTASNIEVEIIDDDEHREFAQ